MLGGGSSGIQTSNSPGNTTLRTERRISSSTLRRSMANKITKSEEAKQGWIQDMQFTDRQKALIRQLVAKDLNDDEFNLYVYRCLGLGLDPLKNEISCQIRTGQDGRKLVVIVQRDGYLTIAHKSG